MSTRSNRKLIKKANNWRGDEIKAYAFHPNSDEIKINFDHVKPEHYFCMSFLDDNNLVQVSWDAKIIKSIYKFYFLFFSLSSVLHFYAWLVFR